MVQTLEKVFEREDVAITMNAMMSAWKMPRVASVKVCTLGNCSSEVDDCEAEGGGRRTLWYQRYVPQPCINPVSIPPTTTLGS